MKNAIGTSHSADHWPSNVEPSGDSAAHAQCPTRPASLAVAVGPGPADRKLSDAVCVSDHESPVATA